MKKQTLIKLIRKLVLITLFTLNIYQANSQTFFRDSTSSFFHKHTSNWRAVTYYKEFITFDSFSQEGEYYTVYNIHVRNESTNTFIDTAIYTLRVFENRVYFTGHIHNYAYDTIQLQDILVYDFNLEIGESVLISLPDTTVPDNNLAYELKLLSISQKTFEDSVTRDVYLWQRKNFLNGWSFWDEDFEFTEGLTSNAGLVFFYHNDQNLDYSQRLISICSKDTLIYREQRHNYLNLLFEDLCNEDMIRVKTDSLHRAGVSITDLEKIKIYPNPACEEIILTWEGNPQSTQVQVYDMQGKKVFSREWNDASIQINTQSWPTGIYTIRVGEQIVRKVIIQK